MGSFGSLLSDSGVPSLGSLEVILRDIWVPIFGVLWGHHEGAVWVPIFGVVLGHSQVTAGSQILGSLEVVTKGHWGPHF